MDANTPAWSLTTGIDSVTSSYSIINAIIDEATAGTNTTWNLTDTLSGSAANATVNLNILSSANNASAAGRSATTVTTLNLQVTDTADGVATASNFSVVALTGLTTLNVANSIVSSGAVGIVDTLTVAGLASTTALSINNNGQFQNVTITGADWSGSTDKLTVNVAGRSGSLTLGTGTNNIETLTVVSSGTTARLAGLTSGTATTTAVTVNGTGIKIDGVLDSTIKTFDGSASTGAVNVSLVTGSTLTSAKGTTGTTDVLAVGSLSTTQTISGFETIVASAAATYDLTNVTDATKVAVAVSTVAAALSAGAVSITNAAATTNTLLLSGANQRTTAVNTTDSLTTGGNVTFALKTATGTSDALTVLVDNAATASTGTFTVGGLLTISGLEVVTFTATDWKAIAFTTGITDVLSSTGNLAFTATATASNLTFNAVTISGGLASGTNTFNLGAVTGTTTEVFTETENFTFTGGTGVDTVTVGAVATLLTQTYNTGAGNDIINVGAQNTLTGTLAINAGDGDDIINLTGSVDTQNVFNIDAGAGTDTLKITAGTSFIDSMIGIEKITNIGAVTTTIAASSTTANNTVEITQIGAATTAFTAIAGQSVNISGVTSVGNVSAATLTLTAAGAGGGTLTGSSTVGTTIVGGTGVDTIIGGAAADIITGGTGADIMTGGITVANTFVFAAGASGIPSATVFDTITDFSAVAANVISVGAQLVLASTVASSAGTAGLGAANGVAATFNAADTTFAQHLAAVELGIRATTNAQWETAQWVEAATDTYIFISDGVDGVGANDILIKLTGITGTNTAFDVLTLAGQTITLA